MWRFARARARRERGTGTKIKTVPSPFQASLMTLTPPKTHAFSGVCPKENPNRKFKAHRDEKHPGGVNAAAKVNAG